MINPDDLNKEDCFVCKKKIDVRISLSNKTKFVYVHFTDMKTDNVATCFLYFCPPCWRVTAGDEFVAEGFEK